MRLYFTLLLVYLRTIIIALIFLIIPFIIGVIFAMITATVLKIAFITIITILTFIFLLFVTHLNSVLEIFVEGMWYEAYTQNTTAVKHTEESSHSGGASPSGSTHHMSLSQKTA